MSDQPEPATGECRQLVIKVTNTDKHGDVSVHYQDVKPTGEWTAETVKAMCLYGDYYTTIADAHEAALFEARKGGVADTLTACEGQVMDLKAQLAAERALKEAFRQKAIAWQSCSFEHAAGTIQQLREQLAAARKLQQLTEDNQVRWMRNCEKLERQLAGKGLMAEREKSYNKGRADAGRAYELAMRDNRELDKQLTAEREKRKLAERASAEWQSAAKEINHGEWISPTDLVQAFQQLREQLAALNETQGREFTDLQQRLADERKNSSLLSIQLMDYHGKLAAMELELQRSNAKVAEKASQLAMGK